MFKVGDAVKCIDKSLNDGRELNRIGRIIDVRTVVNEYQAKIEWDNTSFKGWFPFDSLAPWP